MKPIKLYIVCGFLGTGKTRCIHELMKGYRGKVAHISAEKGRTESCADDTLYIYPHKGTTLKGMAYEIAAFCERVRPEAVWLEWNGTVPIEQLVRLLQDKRLKRLFRQECIIFTTTPQSCRYLLASPDTAVYGQLSEAEKVVIYASSTTEYEETAAFLKKIHSGCRVYSGDALNEDETRQRILKRRGRHGGILTVAMLIAFTSIYAYLLLNTDPYYNSARKVLTFWTATLLQALPFLTAGVLLSSALQLFVPAGWIEKLLCRSHFTGVLTALVAAFCFPLCDCGAVPVFRGLMVRKVPVSTALTFMLAGPLINPVVLVSTYVAFAGNEAVFWWRTLGGMATVFIISVTFFAYKPEETMPVGTVPTAACRRFGERAKEKRFLRYTDHGRGDFFRVIPYVCAGAFISAVFQVYGGTFSATVGDLGLLVIPCMMAAAFFMSVCSTADAVIARNFSAFVPTAGIIGFLIFGPMADLKNYLLMRAYFSSSFVYRLITTIFIVTAFTAAMYVLVTKGV